MNRNSIELIKNKKVLFSKVIVLTHTKDDLKKLLLLIADSTRLENLLGHCSN